MPIHDRHLRRTPYERALPDADFPGRHFPAIEAEARERRVGLADPGAFALLESASESLDELRRADEGAETLSIHAAFLFHAYHHHREGTPALLARTGVVRYLVEADAPGDAAHRTGTESAAPDGLPPSSYVQLPQHLLWAGNGADVPPASVDGFFWTVPGDGSVHVVAIAGLREDRPGFTLLPAPAAPLEDAPGWRDRPMRPEGGPDFASDLPGSELEGLYEIRTAGELLKLGARLDWYLGRFPAAVVERPPPDPGAEPTPSALSCRVVRLEEGDADAS